MQILKKMLKQKAVYFAPTGTHTNQGKPKYATPIDIKCRWEDIQEQFVDIRGAISLSNSWVYVDRDLKTGGVLWLGTVATLTSQSDPFANVGAFEIRKFMKTPTLKATKFLREAVL